MKEQADPSHTPGHILHLKNELISRWEQLPPEHQATMALVLFQQTLEGEYGLWLRSAVKVTDPQENESPLRSSSLFHHGLRV